MTFRLGSGRRLAAKQAGHAFSERAPNGCCAFGCSVSTGAELVAFAQVFYTDGGVAHSMRSVLLVTIAANLLKKQ